MTRSVKVLTLNLSQETGGNPKDSQSLAFVRTGYHASAIERGYYYTTCFNTTNYCYNIINKFSENDMSYVVLCQFMESTML